MIDPDSIPDHVADAAQIAYYEFAFGDEVTLTRRQLGISRQAEKVAIAAALNAMQEGTDD